MRSPDDHGTVGAVALDQHGYLAAATSTGGIVGNIPERISDSVTVAGNYASKFAPISCTGVGEQIVNDGAAVKIETRVRDGRSIVDASNVLFVLFQKNNSNRIILREYIMICHREYEVTQRKISRFPSILLFSPCSLPPLW